ADAADVVAGAQAGAGGDLAVDGGHRVDRGTLAQGDAAVDGGQVAAFDPVAGADAAIDGVGIFEASVVADPDAAVDGAQAAGLLAGGDLDAAVDAADVPGRHGGGDGEREGEGQGVAKHGGLLCWAGRRQQDAAARLQSHLPLLTGPQDVPAAKTSPKPVVLLILDGWGYREDPRDNAIAHAEVPNWRRPRDRYPHTLVHTEGAFVGLPDGQMGNSEVGHMNIGAGRVVYQELTRIDAAIADGSFFENPELVAACDAAIANGRTLHVMGLLSPGGVHSHERHVFAMLELAHRRGVPRVAVHAFLDGRDMPPRSARPSLEALQQKCDELGNARVASVSGRYYAMDRDRRWERVTL